MRNMVGKARRTFAGNEMQNFGDRSAGLGVVARKKGHIKGYTGIYIGLGFGNISQFLNFRIILIPRIKYFQKM
jgi:hypothetical protein